MVHGKCMSCGYEPGGIILKIENLYPIGLLIQAIAWFSGESRDGIIVKTATSANPPDGLRIREVL